MARAEQADSAARLDAVVNDTHDAYISTDLTGEAIAWNAAAERMFATVPRRRWATTSPTCSSRSVPSRLPRRHAAGAGHRRLPALRGSLADRRDHQHRPRVPGRDDAPDRERAQRHLLPRAPARHHRAHHRRRRDEQQRQRLDDEHAFREAVLDSVDVGIAARGTGGQITLPTDNGIGTRPEQYPTRSAASSKPATPRRSASKAQAWTWLRPRPSSTPTVAPSPPNQPPPAAQNSACPSRLSSICNTHVAKQQCSSPMQMPARQDSLSITATRLIVGGDRPVEGVDTR